MRHIITIFTALLTACLLAAPGWAETLKIATIGLAPYGYVEDGKSKGISYDISNAIAREAGYTPENSIVSVDAALKDISDGNVDMVIMFPNPTLETYAINMGIVLAMETVLLGRVDTRFRTFNDVRGKKVAVVRGAKYDERLSKKNGLALIPMNNYSECLKLLVSRRVDAVAGPKLGLYYTAQVEGIPRRALGAPLPLSVGQGSVFLSLATDTTERRKRIGKAIRTLTMNGTVQSIQEKY